MSHNGCPARHPNRARRGTSTPMAPALLTYASRVERLIVRAFARSDPTPRAPHGTADHPRAGANHRRRAQRALAGGADAALGRRANAVRGRRGRYGIARAAAEWRAPLSPNVRVSPLGRLLPVLRRRSRRCAWRSPILLSLTFQHRVRARSRRQAERPSGSCFRCSTFCRAFRFCRSCQAWCSDSRRCFPGRTLGLELAAIILIFTSQAWNLAFSFHQSLITIPSELSEAPRLPARILATVHETRAPIRRHLADREQHDELGGRMVLSHGVRAVRAGLEQSASPGTRLVPRGGGRRGGHTRARARSRDADLRDRDARPADLAPAASRGPIDSRSSSRGGDAPQSRLLDALRGSAMLEWVSSRVTRPTCARARSHAGVRRDARSRARERGAAKSRSRLVRWMPTAALFALGVWGAVATIGALAGMARERVASDRGERGRDLSPHDDRARARRRVDDAGGRRDRNESALGEARPAPGADHRVRFPRRHCSPRCSSHCWHFRAASTSRLWP